MVDILFYRRIVMDVVEDKDMTELVLWGLPKGSTDELDSTILFTRGTTMAQIEKVKVLASADGWHSFRVQILDGSLPDFAKTVNS